MEPRQVFIYCRISSEKQSLESQVHTCVDYCNKKGLFVDAIIKETGSGRNMKKLKKLSKLISTVNNCDIIIYSIDRFSRNSYDAAISMKILDKNNIRLISVSDNIDLSTASGRHAFRMRISAAELETDLISERVKRSIAFKKSKGDAIGVAPYGYSHFKTPSGRTKRIFFYKEKQVIAFITKFCYKYYKSTVFSSDLYKLLELYDKPEDFYVPVVFENGEITVEGTTVSPEMIADILNEYDILKRNKKWTSGSVRDIIKKSADSYVLSASLQTLNICLSTE